MGPRGLVLMHLIVCLSLEVLSRILRFCTYARAKEEALERGIRASCISLHCFTVRSSGGLRLKLERASSGDFTHPVLLQYARGGKLTLERVPLLHVRSSGTLFFWNFWNCFLSTSLHPRPILGILRPSLRHLIEGIDVEHTEALGVKLLSFPTV